MKRITPLALLALAACHGQAPAPAPANAASPKAAAAPPSVYSDASIGPIATDAEAIEAGKFAQEFYGWYAIHEYNLQYAVKERPGAFGKEVLAALQADFDASDKSPSEVVGLDWEPFSGSQDPCGPYRVTRISRQGESILVAMRGMCTDAASRSVPDAVAELVHGQGSWQFADIRHGADSGTLRKDLARLDEDRKKPKGIADK